MQKSSSEGSRAACLLLSIPIEVLQNIVEHCDRETLRSLRLTCSSLSILSARFYFETFTLSLPSDEYCSDDAPAIYSKVKCDIIATCRLRQREAIMQQENLPFLFNNVRDLNIKHYDWVEEDMKEKQEITPGWPLYSETRVLALQNFICSMRKLQTLRWNCLLGNIATIIDFGNISTRVKKLQISNNSHSTRNRVPVPAHLFSAFELLHNLTHLDFKFYENEHVGALNYLPNLKTLVLQKVSGLSSTLIDFFTAQTTPFELRKLTLKNGIQDIDFPEDLVPKFFLKLESLKMFIADRPATATSPELRCPIWVYFKKYNVQLRRLTVLGESPSLVDYLLSYKDTLESLNISIFPHGCDWETRRDLCLEEHKGVETFIDTFWGQIIPLHASTLKGVHLFPGTEHDRLRGRLAPSKQEEEEARKAKRNVKIDMMLLEEPWRLTPAASEALLKCPKLKKLQLGTNGTKGVKEVVELAATIKTLERLEYNLKGRRSGRPPGFRCGNGKRQWHKRMGELRDTISQIELEGLDEISDDRLRRLKIDVVPLNAMTIGRISDSDGKSQCRLFRSGLELKNSNRHWMEEAGF